MSTYNDEGGGWTSGKSVFDSLQTQEFYLTSTGSIPALDAMAYSLGMIRPGRDHILPSSDEVKNE